MIGLYDIDLWHFRFNHPNLEVMKMFNYYLKSEEKIMMMTPASDEGRFSRIIYFKEGKGPIPKNLELSGGKREIFGYDFYKMSEKLPEPIQATPPLFLAYDQFSDRMESNYKTIRRSSLVRLRTEDHTGIQHLNNKLYIVDPDPLKCTNMIETVKYYSDYKIYTFYGKRLTSEEQYHYYKPYFKYFAEPFYLYFGITNDILDEIATEGTKVQFTTAKLPDEDQINYYFRILQTIIATRLRGVKMDGTRRDKKEPFIDALMNWNKANVDQSFASFYKNKPEEKYLLNIPMKMRLMLKQQPSTFNSKDIDFSRKL